MRMVYRRAIDRLRELPDVFTLTRLTLQMDVPRHTATVYLARWQNDGLVASAGRRSGIYYNLWRSDQVTGEQRLQAVLMTYPSAVLIAESVLHAAGWTTQIPQRLSVAVLSRRTLVPLEGFDIHRRPRRWYARVHRHLLRPDTAPFPTYGLKALPPALALADAYGDPHCWHPDPDDLDVDEVEQNADAIEDGFRLLKIEPPDWWGQDLEAYLPQPPGGRIPGG